MSATPKRTQTWMPTKVPNLFQLKESGIFYARVKPRGGSQLRKSLKTSNFSVAREMLRDLLLEKKTSKVSHTGTWGSIVEPYRSWLAGQKIRGDITDSTIMYKVELIDNIRATWQGFDTFKLSNLNEKVLRDWQVQHRSKYSATRTNGATTTLREMLQVAVGTNSVSKEISSAALAGLKFVKVDYDYKRMTLALPEPAMLNALRLNVYDRCGNNGSFGAWLFDFLLFSGCRIESATCACWEDVRWGESGKLYFRKAKYGPYEIPLFPQLRKLLEEIKSEKPGQPSDLILPTKSIQTVLTSSCKSLKISHLSHHDLRHVFATRCIESGVDIPTVASWLGHKDGGRTAMAIYGHLRQTHSQEQAAGMDFLTLATPKTKVEK